MKPAVVEALEAVPVLPLLNVSDTRQAVMVAGTLGSAGLRVIEVLLRGPRAIDCLAAVSAEDPGLLVGAGTVLDEAQAREALKAGARFIVSPGLDETVVEVARAHGVPVIPGIATATEAQRARNMGLRVLKFFPAGLAGGPAMMRAFGEVFPELRFVATGGVSATNLAEYLALRGVLAVGGTWLAPEDAVAGEDYARIARVAREAVACARAQRAAHGSL
jgi:2-dehydro-3-deoxyphosphogluconate aldolase/(4S)-4-hydroxy-2-oxoglutarate aldolase